MTPNEFMDIYGFESITKNPDPDVALRWRVEALGLSGVGVSVQQAIQSWESSCAAAVYDLEKAVERAQREVKEFVSKLPGHLQHNIRNDWDETKPWDGKL